VFDEPLLPAISAEALRKLSGADAQFLSNTLWAFAKLCYDSPPIYAFAASAMARMRDFDMRGLSNTAWAMAKFGVVDPPLMDSIAAAAIRSLSAADAQALGNISWAFAALSLRDQNLMEALASESIPKLADFNPQNLSNTAWSFARLCLRDGQLMEDIAAAAINRISNFMSQNITNLAWSFATHIIRNAPLLTALSAAAIPKISDSSPQDLTNTAWSFSNLACGDWPLLESISAASQPRNEELDTQNLANLVWACATLVFADMPLFYSIAAASLPKMSEFLVCELSNTAWAWAEILVCHAPLLSSIAESLLASLPVSDAQGLSNTAWAFATLIFRHNPLMDAISSPSQPLDGAIAQNVTVGIWSLWKMGRTMDAWSELRKGVRHGIVLDGMGLAYSLMLAEWEKVEGHERELYQMMEGNQNLKLPVQLFELVLRWMGRRLFDIVALPTSVSVALAPSAAYKKLATLLDYVELHVQIGDSSSLMRAIEAFGSGVGQWLKVAADCKAELVEASMKRRCPSEFVASVEMGTFVGYTALRFGRWVNARGPGMAPGRSVSLEVDPIHALITRHHLSLAHLAAGTDVWIGQALDLIPRLAEDLGLRSLTLAFMDHRGTKFHSDLWRLQHHRLFLPGATHVCDNTLKPGAPACLWLMAFKDKGLLAANWSLNEFAHWNSEDWMLVNEL